MNELKVQLTPDQQNEVGLEIERLYFQQGKHLPKEQVPAMVIEIEEEGFPYGAIINGLRRLRDKSMRVLKMCDIKDSIRGLITYVDDHKTCRFCGPTGFVIMRSEMGYTYAIPCVCPRGADFARVQNLVKWNGQVKQLIFGVEYALIHPDPSILNPAMAGAGAEVDWEE